MARDVPAVCHFAQGRDRAGWVSRSRQRYHGQPAALDGQ
jgi:hypothetical protein